MIAIKQGYLTSEGNGAYYVLYKSDVYFVVQITRYTANVTPVYGKFARRRLTAPASNTPVSAHVVYSYIPVFLLSLDDHQKQRGETGRVPPSSTHFYTIYNSPPIDKQCIPDCSL